MNSLQHKLRRMIGATYYKLAPSDISPAGRKYAYKPDSKDVRDRVVAEHVDIPDKLPTMIDLSPYLGSVKDQGDLGSCTGNAYASIREFLAKKYAKETVTLSPMYIYYREREMEGTIAEDSGAEPRDGCRTLVQFGVCREDADPYLVTNFTQPPTPAMDSIAELYKIGAYHRARSIDEIKTGLASGYCPSIGFDVFEAFESDAIAQGPNAGQLPLPPENEQPIGGHEVYAFGYDDKHLNLDNSTGAFMIRNSWGLNWGLSGNFWMPYTYVNNHVSDIWFVHLGKPWRPKAATAKTK